jgi:hypothetical protein
VAAGAIVDAVTGEVAIPLTELLATDGVEESYEYHHRPTQPVDPETGQGDAHVAFAFAAQRAIVDVDLELGLTKVVEIAVAEDVGTAINPQAIAGSLRASVSRSSKRSSCRKARSATPPSRTTCCPPSPTCRRCGSSCSRTPSPTPRTE